VKFSFGIFLQNSAKIIALVLAGFATTQTLQFLSANLFIGPDKPLNT